MMFLLKQIAFALISSFIQLYLLVVQKEVSNKKCRGKNYLDGRIFFHTLINEEILMVFFLCLQDLVHV